MTIFLLLSISYLLGSVSFGYLYFFYKEKKDVRGFGSGNLGATNLCRLMGKKAGVITFLFDFLKGFFVVIIGICAVSKVAATFAGLSAVIGHIYPVFLKFKGGKGVATLFGVIAALDYFIALMVFLSWLGVFKFSKYSSLASIISLVIALLLFIHKYGIGQSSFAVVFAILFVIIKHYPNFIRILKREELGFGVKDRD